MPQTGGYISIWVWIDDIEYDARIFSKSVGQFNKHAHFQVNLDTRNQRLTPDSENKYHDVNIHLEIKLNTNQGQCFTHRDQCTVAVDTLSFQPKRRSWFSVVTGYDGEFVKMYIDGVVSFDLLFFYLFNQNLFPS